MRKQTATKSPRFFLRNGTSSLVIRRSQIRSWQLRGQKKRYEKEMKVYKPVESNTDEPVKKKAALKTKPAAKKVS